MTGYDVVIVGGGTAGLFLARELGRKKRKTLVIDRKDDLLKSSFKTLGSFINLEEFDLTENVVAQKLQGGVLYSKSFRRAVEGSVYILDKSKVHQELLEGVNSEYVTIKLKVDIKKAVRGDQGTFNGVIDKEGNEYSGKIFVDASGTNGVISKHVGLQEKRIRHATGVEFNVKYLGKPTQAHLFIGKQYQGGYGWIFPLQDERAIIGFGSFDNAVRKDLKTRLNAILETPVIKNLVVKDNQIVEGGSIPLTPVLEKFVLNNLICVGDSVSQVNPVAGEGYKFIFESAVMASKAIDTSLATNDIKDLLTYELDWKNRFSESYKRAKFLQEKVFRFSKNDFLMDAAMLYLNLLSDNRILNALSGEFTSTKR